MSLFDDESTARFVEKHFDTLSGNFKFSCGHSLPADILFMEEDISDRIVAAHL